ncbi:MAG: ABC transporter permease, partial [Saprospiraceae bacterium]|nr:ABC transporter permease [Saprospiraceae bacterium]
MLAKLAWRNIWRNRRRTIITAASIVFAVLLSVLMDSVKDGILDKMKENVVGLYTGYAQIHSSGYWAQRTLENSFHQAQDLKRRVAAHADVRTVIPRLESFTLAASQDHSKGSMIVSIDPAGEAAVTNLDDKVVSGSYLEGDDQAVLVTEGLANYLRLTIEDSIVLLGQGFQGATAVGKYPIKGLVKFGSPELNQGLIYIPLEEGQKFFGAEQRLTAFVLMLRDIDGAEEVAGRLASELGADFEVLSWQEMSPELDQFIQGEST